MKSFSPFYKALHHFIAQSANVKREKKIGWLGSKVSLLKGGKTFRAPIGKWCLNGFLFNGNYRVSCFGGLFWSVAIPPTVDVDGFPPVLWSLFIVLLEKRPFHDAIWENIFVTLGYKWHFIRTSFLHNRIFLMSKYKCRCNQVLKIIHPSRFQDSIDRCLDSNESFVLLQSSNL